MKEDKILEKIYEHSKPYIRLMSYYKCAMMEIETKFKVLNEEFSLESERNPISSIKTRLKSPLSIEEKLKRQKLKISLETLEENLFDVAGIRVICNLPEDVYTIAELLLKQDDITLLRRSDYIAEPKSNGYRSLHLIVEVPVFLQSEKKMVRAEVQLRTTAMELWANLEHRLRYKKDLNEELLRQTALELAECAVMTYALDEKMQRVRDVIEK